ncbi:putative ER-associated proteolytic system protein Der1 [Aspergillus campestris IBT 28561]|uniref:Derlin n=1 Tax=Aspergillus campestris (strain IBT 28561) TaxID=1392248 RepID=A0A2I1DAG7_ASPC2|nr:putative ER-associated proteolytic system protein Der1 [Aspergillus campestris IBT 28561]PKY06852.1 putative ER-associated proteolytic system protein Der1 [Aspergillus campestris IBT 28561]
MAAIWGNGAQGGQFPLEQWFYEMPPVTRWWTAATVATAVMVQCHILTPFQLFYSFRAVYVKSQYWRLFTSFLYFGPLSLDLLFHVFFLQRYSRLLEESSGRSPAHFSWLLFYAMVFLLCISPILSMPFMGTGLSSSLVYIWSRRNPDTRLSFLGLLVFTAPYLPWVLMGFSLVVHGIVPKDEFCGVVVGHIWYYFNDIYPDLHGGRRPLDPPMWWLRLFDRAASGSGATDVDREIATAAAREVR